MSREDDIQQKLASKFSYLTGDKIRVQRQRRIYVDLAPQNFAEVFNYATGELAFSMLCTITGLDEGETFGFIYHLAKSDGTILNLKTHAPKNNPVIKTITHRFPSADIYERELVDLFGVKVEGLPKGIRYPLPDDWPQGEYPLRKDWKAPEKKGKDTK
jgi:Ni,Fe-hydrogenase III component G